jgi:hypothetical protein
VCLSKFIKLPQKKSKKKKQKRMNQQQVEMTVQKVENWSSLMLFG